MKLAIFGGTGKTGRHLVEKALERGYEVSLLARTPSKLTLKDPKLNVVAGDVQNAAAVTATISAADAVISVLGPTSNDPVFAVSQGMDNILSTMKKEQIQRLIMTAGAGVGDPKDEPKLVNRIMNFLLKLAAKNVLADMSRAVEMVRASDREWTVVRLPMLTDDPPTGQVRVAYVGKGMGMRISRADVADFLLDQVEDRTYIRESPAISN